MVDRDHATRRRTGVADLRMELDSGDVFVVDLQRPRRFLQAVAGKSEGQGRKQDNAARDHGKGDEVIGEISFHGSLWRKRCRAETRGRAFTWG